MAVVTTEQQGDIAVITIANPPVNALSHAVRTGLQDAFRAANADAAIKAIVVTGSGRAFSAGADITEFASGQREPGLSAVLTEVEASPKPVVAAINGLALGGGLETTLACHYRIASKAANQLGLPEVKIGIIPGAGGTQRLPRAIGFPAALDMITTGAPIDAAKAKAAGLVAEVVDGDVVAAAIAYAKDLISKGAGPTRLCDVAVDPATLPASLFEAKRASLARHPSGPLAPKSCVDAVEAAATMPFRQGLARERELILQCMTSPYAKALQYAFFAERQAANLPDIGADIKPRAITNVGIIGAGTMGTGIGLAFLNAGIPVTLIEMQPAALEKGAAYMKSTVESLAKRGRISEAEAKARIAKLTPSLKFEDLASCELIIEAVFESMAVKRDVFGKLDRIAKPGAILASNTSTLDVNAIAAMTQRPGDVLGLHFFSPANIMRLLEIVRAEKTGKDVMATAMTLSKRIGKVGVVAGVCFGFIGNRMVEAYLEEVRAMMLEGATPREVDAALEDWGLAMGPNAMMDLAGLDVGYKIAKERTLTNAQTQNLAISNRIVELGRLGQKSGAGYYKYVAGDRKPQVDPEIEALIRDEAKKQGVPQRKLPAEEIVERALLRLINEGAQILDDKIAIRASDIDTIYLNGYGFPAWRGGPMWQADFMGLAKVAEKISGYDAKYGSRWALAPLIARLAKEGKSFADLDGRGGKS